MQSASAIWNDGAAMIGLPTMTGHMARHACATIYLAAHPGDYETVASLLGDKVETVRAFYGRDSGHEAAARFRAALERHYPKLFTEMKI
jgi:integrase